MRLAVLVTGSRDWSDRAAVEAALRAVLDEARPTEAVLLHGEAQGADAHADHFARVSRWTVLPMPAPWRTLGRAAGPARNTQMVTVLRALKHSGYQCRVLAFPMERSVGTWDCVRKARGAGFNVQVFGLEGDGIRPR